MLFIRENSNTFEMFKALCSKLQTKKYSNIGKIVRIRGNHGREFENAIFTEYCDKHGIAHEFSTPTTPEQNGIVERKNRTIQEMARAMLKAKGGISSSVLARKKNTKSRGSKSVPAQNPKYGKAVVRGITFEFTPAIINAYLDSERENAPPTPNYDEIVKEITGGVRIT